MIEDSVYRGTGGRPSHGGADRNFRVEDAYSALLLEDSQQPFCFGQGQPSLACSVAQVGDIGDITGPLDRHDVSGLSLTVSVDFYQP